MMELGSEHLRTTAFALGILCPCVLCVFGVQHALFYDVQNLKEFSRSITSFLLILRPKFLYDC